MNLHVKLKLIKMTICTKALEIMARKENAHLREIDNEITENMRLLTVNPDPQSHTTLTMELEDLSTEKNEILDRQGSRLALRAKTKWYNEGEH
jgi:hypothetical protein